MKAPTKLIILIVCTVFLDKMKTINGEKVDIVLFEAEIMLHTYNNIYLVESIICLFNLRIL